MSATSSPQTEVHRTVFRVLIDYTDTFEGTHQHLALFLWRPDGPAYKGANFTAVVLDALYAQQLQLGLLPEETANTWSQTALRACLQQLSRHFEVVSTDETHVSPAASAADHSCSGTAQAVLRHRVFREHVLRLRFLKKAALWPQAPVYLVDNDGHSALAKHSKKVKVFTLSFLTNTHSMTLWTPTPLTRKRPRKGRSSGHNKAVHLSVTPENEGPLSLLG